MTDGRSNEQSSECQWDTIQAAEAVHRLSPPVLVYVIGVTDSINEQELEAIATDREDITYLASFNSHILQTAQEDHLDEVCEKGIQYTCVYIYTCTSWSYMRSVVIQVKYTT